MIFENRTERTTLRRRTCALILLCSGAALHVEHISAEEQLKTVGLFTVAPIEAQATSIWLDPFHKTLRERGWVEGKNVAFQYADAGGDPTRIAQPLTELARKRPTVLMVVGPPVVRSAFATIKDVPIIAHDLETDPVAAGYAKTYAKPGGNLTGLFLDSPDLAGKWIELIKALYPTLSRAVVLWDPTSGPIPLNAVQSAAPSFGIKLQVLDVRNPSEIEKLPARFSARPEALIVLPSPMMYYESEALAALARSQRLPATSMFARFAEAGGLLAYGPDLPATAERCAELVARVLGGADPGQLPIERPTKFEFVVNLSAAKQLRLNVPEALLVRADRVLR
jgi:putative ABC transport system substrate-binding protein